LIRSKHKFSAFGLVLLSFWEEICASGEARRTDSFFLQLGIFLSLKRNSACAGFF
jgi:hypothetical protein